MHKPLRHRFRDSAAERHELIRLEKADQSLDRQDLNTNDPKTSLANTQLDGLHPIFVTQARLSDRVLAISGVNS